MRTLQVTILDDIIVVDDVGRLVPGLKDIDPQLLAVDWDGSEGVLVYRDRTEQIDDPTVLDPWFQLFDDHAPPPVLLPEGTEPSREADDTKP